jgi:hypothetical protein
LIAQAAFDSLISRVRSQPPSVLVPELDVPEPPLPAPPPPAPAPPTPEPGLLPDVVPTPVLAPVPVPLVEPVDCWPGAAAGDEQPPIDVAVRVKKDKVAPNVEFRMSDDITRALPTGSSAAALFSSRTQKTTSARSPGLDPGSRAALADHAQSTALALDAMLFRLPR